MNEKLYVVLWFKNNAIANVERYANIEDAKRHAIEKMRLYRALEIADSALIHDDDGVEYMRLF